MPDRLVDRLIGLYEQTQAPTILFDDNLEYIWSNQEASKNYPFLKTYSGVNMFLSERDRNNILMKLKKKNDKISQRKNWAFSYPIDSPFAPSSSLNFTVFSVDEATSLYLCTVSENQNSLPELNSDDLFSMVSYHLREPLFYVFSSIDALELLIKDDEEDFLKRKKSALAYISSISDNSYHILRVVSMINKYLKLTTGLPAGDHRETFLLNTFIEDLSHALHITTNAEQAPFFYKIHDEPMVVNADPDEVSSIIFQLISNAFLYSKEGNKISLILKREGNFAVIEVMDKGIGISEDRLKSVFAPFNNICVPLQNSKGLGLGLSISLMSAIKLGGDLTISSEENIGTTATFKIPLVSSLKTKIITLKQGDVSFISNKFSNLYLELPGIAKRPSGG